MRDLSGRVEATKECQTETKVVYTVAGKPAAYQDISIPLFVEGYLVIMKGEEGAIRQRMASHLKELMSDAEVYGWEHTRTFHSVWLNQLEQGRCTWMMRRSLGFAGHLLFHPPQPLPLLGLHQGSGNTSTQEHIMPQLGLAPRPTRPIISNPLSISAPVSSKLGIPSHRTGV